MLVSTLPKEIDEYRLPDGNHSLVQNISFYMRFGSLVAEKMDFLRRTPEKVLKAPSVPLGNR
jgi:hypothetical protein